MDIFKNARYINKGLASLLAALFLVTIASTVYLSKTLIDSRSLINNGTNTVSAVLLLQDLELNVRTAESSARGYVITHDSKHIETFKVVIKIIPEEQKALSNKSYNIDENNRVILNKLISQRLSMLQIVVHVRDTEGFDSAEAIISSNKDFDTTNKIEKLSRDITRENLSLIP
jgi:CHASE3 domain sensor protein